MNNNQGRSQDFQRGGGSIFYWKGQSRERAKRALLTYVYASFWNWSPWWVQVGKPLKTFHFLAFENPRLRENWHPECFFLSEFFQHNDDFYGDFCGDLYGDFYGDTFVATNFLISLFLFFPLYDFYFILLASQRASQSRISSKRGGRSHPPNPLATRLTINIQTIKLVTTSNKAG